MVWSDPVPLGRNAAAMAGAVSAGGIFLQSAPDHRLRVLPVFLLRELALHRNLHGRRPRSGTAAGDHGRSGFCGARLVQDFFQPRGVELRHEDCGGGASAGLVRDDCGYRLAGNESNGHRTQRADSDDISQARRPVDPEISGEARIDRTELRLEQRTRAVSSASSYGTQSPIKMLVSCGAFAFRFDAQTNFL